MKKLFLIFFIFAEIALSQTATRTQTKSLWTDTIKANVDTVRTLSRARFYGTVKVDSNIQALTVNGFVIRQGASLSDTGKFLLKTDSTRFLKGADSTTMRTYSDLKYATKDSISTHRTAINLRIDTANSHNTRILALVDSVSKPTKYHTQAQSTITNLSDTLNKFSRLANANVFTIGQVIQNTQKSANILTNKNFLGVAVANIDSTGDVIYNFIHWVGSADSVSYIPVVSQWAYTRLRPALVAHDEHSITMAGDSLRIPVSGDYEVQFSITASGANQNDYWRIKIYKNGYSMPSSVGRFRWKTSNSGQTDTKNYFWYLIGMAVGDQISFWITNETASRNPTITDMKVYIKKLPEM